MTENAPPKFIGIHCGSPARHQAPGRERSAISERRHFGRPVDIEADPCGEEPVGFFEQNAVHFGRPIGRKTDDVVRPLHEHREADTAKRFSGQSRRRRGGCPSGINPFKRQSDAGMKIPAGALPCAAVLSASCCLQVCKDRAIDRQAVCSIERSCERENRIRFVNAVNAVRIRFTERRRRIGRLKQWCWDHEAEVRKGPEVVFFEPISLIGCWRRSLRQTCAGVHGFCAFPARVGRYAVQTKCLVRCFGRLLSIRRTGVRPWGRCRAERLL